MKRWLVFLLVCITIYSLAGAVSGGSSLPENRSLARSPGSLLRKPQIRQVVPGDYEFLIYLKEQADLSQAAGLSTKEEKGRYVVDQLRSTALQAQETVLSELERSGVEHRSYWIANMIWVRGTRELARALADRTDVAHVYENPEVLMEEPEPSEPDFEPSTVAGLTWNIDDVNADEVWVNGVTGEGVVIGGQDTGYDWDHPALINSYRGWDGTNADHNYNWHDAIRKSNDECEADSAFPCDDHGHGTHTMGIMVGDDGAGNQIGMAPGARWIGCRNMNNGVGTPKSYIECFEWFLAPYALNEPSSKGDPSKAPDIINNSWTCTVEEGCIDPNLLRDIVQNVRAAGILVVAAAGNDGPECSTITEPPGMYDASFTVGNTNSEDLINLTSSRGPVTTEENTLLKPDVTAPGTGIYSSLPGTGYGFMTGTSMAAPHVAGQAALLISVDPALRGQVDEIEDLIRKSAEPKTSAEVCGGDAPGGIAPNNTYGYGVIDALRAVVFTQLDYFYYLPVVVNGD